MQFFRAEKRDAHKVLVYPAIRSLLIFGNGNNNGTEPLPADYTDRSRFEVALSGNGQLFVAVAVVALGAGGLTGVTLLIEFYDQDTGLWYPSKEGAARTADAATQSWACNAAGNFLVASRLEPPIFTTARVSFKKSAGDADDATRIRVAWYPNSLLAPAWARG